MDDGCEYFSSEEEPRQPTHAVPHYVTYLRRYVTATAQRVHRGGVLSDRREESMFDGRPTDSITPMSYFIRKLKLDLKMAYPSFVSEFVQAPNNGLRLLIKLLKNLFNMTSNPAGGSVPRARGGNSWRMADYKKTLIDEHDCLLCIKYTLRTTTAREELIEDNCALINVTSCLLSHNAHSRVTALEVLCSLVSGPTSVDKVLDTFTALRIKHAESTRFKMLVAMMNTKGAPNILFQVNCLRLLNSLLKLCRSANMRVFLQYEMEEAGLNCDKLMENCHGDGLEYDDLKKEIKEWKTKYIDVTSLLRKIRTDMKKDLSNSIARLDFDYDPQFTSQYSATISDIPAPGQSRDFLQSTESLPQGHLGGQLGSQGHLGTPHQPIHSYRQQSLPGPEPPADFKFQQRRWSVW